MDKVQKIREEAERLYNQSLADENRQADRGLERAANVSYGKSKACKKILSFIDSLQEDFNISPVFDEGYWERLGEESVSDIDFEQELYKAFGQVKDFTLGLQIAKRFYDMGRNHQEPVSEELEEAAVEWFNSVKYKSDLSGTPINAFKAGAKWQAEQFEKNRLKRCNNITNEQAELEQSFIDQHLDKHQRMPTFLDAIEYGMQLMKEQLMKDAFEFTKEHNTACVLASECLRNNGWFNRERDFNDLFRHLSCVDELFEGKFSGKTKVIVIKEDRR